MKIYIFEDYVCPGGKTSETFTVNEGDVFGFATNLDGANYGSKMDCRVKYKLGSCKKLLFSCQSFDLRKGDMLFVKYKKKNLK